MVKLLQRCEAKFNPQYHVAIERMVTMDKTETGSHVSQAGLKFTT